MGKVIELKNKNKGKPLDLTAPADESAAIGTVVDEPADAGNARLFSKQHEGKLLHCEALGWLIWDGKRWERDPDDQVMRYALETAGSLMTLVNEAPDLDERKRAFARYTTAHKRERLRAMIDMSRHMLAVGIDALDRDPYLLNCRNGTVDLRTGELRNADPGDRITKLTDIDYVRDATAPRFDRFLNEIFKGDANAELSGYIQRLFGYSLVARQLEHVLVVLHGRGSNGKSTLVKTLALVAGEYGQSASPSLLLAKKNDGGIPNDVARLKGARFVHAFETDEGKRLNAARMKNLTGNDKISARFLHHEYFDFEPTHTLWLGTNDKPDVDATDTGTWRRIKLVPFKSRFEGAREDKTLGDKLADEREGILAWAVRGAIAWWNRGKPSLIEPKVVTDAVGEYKGEMDRLSDFITARCDVNDKYEATAEELYGAYQHWAPTVGIRYPWTQTRFSSRLGNANFEKKRSGDRTTTLYLGLRLKRQKFEK